MKKTLIFLLLPISISTSCSKDKHDPSLQAAMDDAAIKKYIAADTSIHAIKDSSGLYYQVKIKGTGNYPKATSNVTVNYKGKLLNGTSFDSGTATTIGLGDAVKAWQIGIPHINNGGRILMMVPSRLGYADAKHGNIPANSVLVFTVDLLRYK